MDFMCSIYIQVLQPIHTVLSVGQELQPINGIRVLNKHPSLSAHTVSICRLGVASRKWTSCVLKTSKSSSRYTLSVSVVATRKGTSLFCEHPRLQPLHTICKPGVAIHKPTSSVMWKTPVFQPTQLVYLFWTRSCKPQTELMWVTTLDLQIDSVHGLQD